MTARIQRRMVTAVLGAGLLTGSWASAQTPAPPPNVQRVALLRWYKANTTAEFTVPGAWGVAFDGEHLWVSNQAADLDTPGTVTKLATSDGAVLGTFPVGLQPSGL